MTTAPSTHPQTTPSSATTPPREVIIYGHTALFYWWPVWSLAFLFGMMSWFGHARAAFVPPDSEYHMNATVAKSDGSPIDGKRNVIVLPIVPGQNAPVGLPGRAGQEMHEGDTFRDYGEHVHPDKNYGVAFTLVLFLVILITSIPLRGLSSFLVMSFVLVMILFVTTMGWWEHILGAFGRLSLHMNMGFFIFFAIILFIAWAFVVFFYDGISYWRITKDQITHEYRIGGGQKSYNTEGMAFEKLRDDMFRHWVLGFGSGDLIMYPMQSAGANREELQIHNVLFVGKKLALIQELIAAKPN
jgi:hypothetical protein